MSQCPRCASEIHKKDKVCPRCGLPVDRMQNFEEDKADNLEKEAESKKLNLAQKREKKKQAKIARKEAKRQKKLQESVSNTDFSQFAVNAEHKENNDEVLPKRKVKKADRLQFELDENGEINIDTSDVEIIGEDAGKIFDEKQKQTYSLKKARGDYRPPKVKWWEIYKLADRAFARRKIKKEVSKASKVKPEFINYTKLLLLSIFFGWCGVHNFYAKNKRKGWVSVVCCIISTLGVLFGEVPFVAAIQLWLVGCSGFIVLLIWFGDIINIISRQFKYRIQTDKFISSMNIETRAKLGEKYIDLELLHKPWYVRFKVWWQKKKSNYYEWKAERRQHLIEKEKAKQEKQLEKAELEKEIAAADSFQTKPVDDKKVAEVEKEETLEVKKKSSKNNTQKKSKAKVVVSKKKKKK